jgi:hypothetical protein
MMAFFFLGVSLTASAEGVAASIAASTTKATGVTSAKERILGQRRIELSPVAEGRLCMARS